MNFFSIIKIRGLVMKTNGVLIMERIDALRKKKGISRKEISEKCGVAENTMAAWNMRGTILSADVAFKIAKMLDTSIEYLLYGTDSEMSQEDRDILAKWHSLSDYQKNSVIILLEGFAAENVKEYKKLSSDHLA